MTTRLSLIPGLAAASALVLATLPAGANTGEAGPSPDACLKSVNGLGASMGHTEKTDADGRVTYTFRLRTSGQDYQADCDAATGVVSDVRPYFGRQSG